MNFRRNFEFRVLNNVGIFKTMKTFEPSLNVFSIVRKPFRDQSRIPWFTIICLFACQVGGRWVLLIILTVKFIDLINI